MRLTEWPRSPYLNDELREWMALHLRAIGVDDVAVYALAVGADEEERRILVATEVGLLDGWYAPRGSSARYSLRVRLFPWQAVHGVDLRGETVRLWAREHQSRWRLRIARPELDLLADTPELGNALVQFAAACAVMAEPAGAGPVTEPPAAESHATELHATEPHARESGGDTSPRSLPPEPSRPAEVSDEPRPAEPQPDAVAPAPAPEASLRPVIVPGEGARDLRAEVRATIRPASEPMAVRIETGNGTEGDGDDAKLVELKRRLGLR